MRNKTTIYKGRKLGEGLQEKIQNQIELVSHAIRIASLMAIIPFYDPKNNKKEFYVHVGRRS